MNIRDTIRQTVIDWLGWLYPMHKDAVAVEWLVDALMLSLLTCLRCGHQWYPKAPRLPKTCPNPRCKSPYWNRERRVKASP